MCFSLEFTKLRKILISALKQQSFLVYHIFFKKYFLCMGILPIYTCVCVLCTVCLVSGKPEECVSSTGIGITHVFELLFGCWESNSSYFEEQITSLTMAPSLQP